MHILKPCPGCGKDASVSTTTGESLQLRSGAWWHASCLARQKAIESPPGRPSRVDAMKSFLVWYDRGPEGVGAFAFCQDKETAEFVKKTADAASSCTHTISEIEMDTMYEGLWDIRNQA